MVGGGWWAVAAVIVGSGEPMVSGDSGGGVASLASKVVSEQVQIEGVRSLFNDPRPEGRANGFIDGQELCQCGQGYGEIGRAQQRLGRSRRRAKDVVIWR